MWDSNNVFCSRVGDHMTLEQPLKAQLYSGLRSSDPNRTPFNLPMWKVSQALGCRCGDPIRRRPFPGGSRWIARLPDLGSPVCTATDRNYRMEGTTAESASKPNSNKQNKEKTHAKNRKNKKPPEGLQTDRPRRSSEQGA
ncbi:hypothetical protein SLEP1_g59719 [Rubroshorea leprosula]|uniref:Uncharacterized protein n=1 Tax=Rubroshorea leprosula TaxID=152421 RepID=A0AAV5MT67_9ROSI|nr:hypothetical protein SLEP1_g59719 [Rubroshorea leprosula]